MSLDIGTSVSGMHIPPANIPPASYAFREEPENVTSNTSAAPDDGMSTGLQVVYEDPTQAAERRKLLSLLNGAPGQSKAREERTRRAAVAATPSLTSGRRM